MERARELLAFWEAELRKELPPDAEIFDVHTHLGHDIDAVVVQADHDEYRKLSASDLPGAQLVINGRPSLHLDLGGEPEVLVVGSGAARAAD